MSFSQPNDFAAEVMASLIKRKITLRGLPPASVQVNLDGSLKLWFGVDGNSKALTIHDAGINGAYALGRSDVVAEMAEAMIDHSNARYF